MLRCGRGEGADDGDEGGRFELVASDRLLAELERALGHPKLRRRVDQAEAAAVVALIRAAAVGL